MFLLLYKTLKPIKIYYDSIWAYKTHVVLSSCIAFRAFERRIKQNIIEKNKRIVWNTSCCNESKEVVRGRQLTESCFRDEVIKYRPLKRLQTSYISAFINPSLRILFSGIHIVGKYSISHQKKRNIKFSTTSLIKQCLLYFKSESLNYFHGVNINKR